MYISASKLIHLNPRKHCILILHQVIVEPNYYFNDNLLFYEVDTILAVIDSKNCDSVTIFSHGSISASFLCIR